MLAPDLARRRAARREALRLLASAAFGAAVTAFWLLCYLLPARLREARVVASEQRLTVRTVLMLPDSGAWVRLVPEPGRYRVEREPR